MLEHRKRPATPPGGLWGAPPDTQFRGHPLARGGSDGRPLGRVSRFLGASEALDDAPSIAGAPLPNEETGIRDRKCTFCLIQCTNGLTLATTLGLIAGGGNLPARVLVSCRRSGRPVFVIALEDQADAAALELGDVPHAWVRLGAAGKALRLLREAGVRDLLLAGSVRRPSLAALRPDRWTAGFLMRSGAGALGDDGLLSALTGELESRQGISHRGGQQHRAGYPGAEWHPGPDVA